MRRIALAFLCAFLCCATASATITSTANTIVALGNGSNTVFTFNFVGVKSSDIVVTYTDASGNATVLTQGSQYILSLNAPSTGSVWGIGGTVTYPLAGSPIASGTTLTISRQMPLTQTTSSNQGQLFPEAVEQGLDTGVMQTQQVNSLLGHSIMTGQNDTCSSLGVLPSSVQRASQLIGFDSTGCNPIVAQPSSALVSAAMQPVVAAATIPDAQALLGIGSSANVPVGAELDWPGLTAPTYWHLEDGSALSRTTYSALLGAIAPTVPCTITSGSATITGISSTVGWAPGWIIESPGSSALTTGQTIATVGGSSVTISGGVASANATVCQIFPYGTAQDGTFNLPNAAGVVYAGIDTSNTNLNSTYFLANPAQINALGGSQSKTLLTANLPPYTPSGSIALSLAAHVPIQSGIGGSPAGTVNFSGGSTSVIFDTATAAFTGSAQGGTSTPLSTVQPTRIRNKIIFLGVL